MDIDDLHWILIIKYGISEVLLMTNVEIVLGFFVSFIISSIIIYLVAKLFGEKEGFRTAILASFAGAIIFTLASYFIGIGWIAALLGSIGWLIALGALYDISWMKSTVIATFVWVFAIMISLVFPNII